MKKIIAIILLVISLTGVCFGQTPVNISATSSGWKRVAEMNSNAGRGIFEVTIYTIGGSFRPYMSTIKWFKDWSDNGGMLISNESSSAYWSDSRITYDGTKAYLELYFTSAVTSDMQSFAHPSKWGSITLYTGNLPDGGGTIICQSKIGKFNVDNKLFVNYYGYVGIGTTLPNAQLHVFGSGTGEGSVASSIMIGKNNGPEIQAIQQAVDDDVQSMAFMVKSSSTNADANFEAMRIKFNGNVGIGSTNPIAKLEIFSRTANEKILRFNIDRPWFFSNTGTGANSQLALQAEYGAKGFYIKDEIGSAIALFHANGSSGTSHVKIYKNLYVDGQVGIGTNTPSYKLAVNGTIGAKEVIVTNDNWPDYVFTSDYQLKTLKEVEYFIKENQHLPDVPSAKEIAEEGISLGEMNALLLQKIEELTLYVIELKKENTIQQENIEELLYKVCKLKK